MIFLLNGGWWHCGLDVFFSYGARSDIYQTRFFPVLMMADREKGELNAGQLVFSEALAAACTRHIHKNMEKQRLVSKRGSDSSLWLKVAAAADERDDWMKMLQRTFLRQAEFLSEIPATCGRIVNS
jgi:hypothetical protein